MDLPTFSLQSIVNCKQYRAWSDSTGVQTGLTPNCCQSPLLFGVNTLYLHIIVWIVFVFCQALHVVDILSIWAYTVSITDSVFIGSNHILKSSLSFIIRGMKSHVFNKDQVSNTIIWYRVIVWSPHGRLTCCQMSGYCK